VADIDLIQGQSVPPSTVTKLKDMGDGTHAEVVSFGPGGGVGPVSVADGADVAEGATADAAVDSDTTGTVSGKLRGLVKILANVWDSVNGWLKVTIGSVQLDDTDKLAVSLYGKGSAAGDTELDYGTYGLKVAIVDAGVGLGDGKSNTIRAPQGYTGDKQSVVGSYPFGFNSSTWDRQRNNVEATLLASAARTATANSADQVSYNSKGLVLYLDVTSVTDTPSITLSLEIKDSIGGGYFTVWTAAAAVTATGDKAYLFVPGGAAGSYTEAVNLVVSRTWRLTVTHADADSITYSCSCCMLV